VSILVHFHPGSMTRDQYEQVISGLKGSGVPFPPDGCSWHACFGPEGDLRVSEIWESREQFEAFGVSLIPAIEASGVALTSPPDVFEVHQLVVAQ
jgi:hypothetical protein